MIGIYLFYACLGLSIPISFVLRDAPPFKQIWTFWYILLMMLLVMLVANKAKKDVKDWWSK